MKGEDYMFLTFDFNSYESDLIGDRLMYIDRTAGNPGYGVLQRYTDKSNPETSIYGRKMRDEIHQIKKFIQDIDREIKETKRRIEIFAQGGKMTGQRETEMRTIHQNFFRMKLDAIKTRASLEREMDKSRKEDIKLMKDITGSAPTNITNTIGDERSSDRNFMSNIFSSGVDGFFAATTTSPNNNIPIVQALPPAPITQPLPTPVKEPVVTNIGEKEQVNTSTIMEEVKQSYDYSNIIEEQKQVQAIIKNANGEDVPIYAEGPEDFVQDDGAFTNAKLAYENISLVRDPNVQKVFKFNEDLGMGWLAFYDMNKREEIKNKGTVYNTAQIYPFEIDKQNGLVNTVLQETFPLLYTDEEPTEKVKSEYERLKRIEESKLSIDE